MKLVQFQNAFRPIYQIHTTDSHRKLIQLRRLALIQQLVLALVHTQTWDVKENDEKNEKEREREWIKKSYAAEAHKKTSHFKLLARFEINTNANT